MVTVFIHGREQYVAGLGGEAAEAGGQHSGAEGDGKAWEAVEESHAVGHCAEEVEDALLGDGVGNLRRAKGTQETHEIRETHPQRRLG